MAKRSGKGSKPKLSIAQRRAKAIQPFINTKGMSDRTIREVFRDLEPILRTSHGVYKSKSTKNKKAAANSVGLSERRKWKAVPYVNNGDDKTKLRVSSSGNVSRVSEFAVEHTITFNQRRLAKGGSDYVASTVASYGDDTEFTVNNGPYTMDGHPQYKRRIGAYVERLMMEYGKDNKGHYWKQWLHGLTYYEPINQISPREYLRSRHRKRKSKAFKSSRRQERKQWFKKHGL